MKEYFAIRDRIDTLIRDINSKTVKLREAKAYKEYSKIQVLAEEILDLKTLTRVNEDILICVFNTTPSQGYHVN